MSKSSNLSVRQLFLTQRGIPEDEATALATDIFDHFCGASSMREIIDLYRSICDLTGLRPGRLNDFYPKLKTKIHSWQAQALWKKFDARASNKIYCKANACATTRILVIGAGPCGLRTAIEAQFLGAKVVVIEKRDKISRNNVLHLWPFVISDLKNLGAKKFYGKFCAGSIDHISIKQLQFILLKVALLLGVEIHDGVCFENVVEPRNGSGWRAQVSPDGHAVSFYEFDVLVGADGKRNTLDGFKHKEFRGKLAIAITANFINNRTEAEAKAEEISGVAFIFNQSFFKELYQKTGIDLENIVYYKDETHYFVMTAKKQSLIEKGVIKQDVADPSELLAPINVHTEKLLEYAREAADFSTKFGMPNLQYAVNHYGKPDVAMFDFTSMYAAEASCRVIIRKKFRLLQCLVGDSLLEPFWPTGSGCARGFLSSLDAAYAIKMWAAAASSNILATIGQRESVYRLLAQTTPENLHRDIEAYTLDPATRYPNLNKYLVNFWQVKHLVDTDDQLIFEPTFHGTMAEAMEKSPLNISFEEHTALLSWIRSQLYNCDFIKELNEVSHCFTTGKVLCSLINRYYPNLLDVNALMDWSPEQCNELAFEIFEKDLGIPRVMTASDSINLKNINLETSMHYLQEICNLFRGEVPQVSYTRTDYSELKTRMRKKKMDPDFSILLQVKARCTRISPHNDLVTPDATKRNKKRKTIERGLKIEKELKTSSLSKGKRNEQFKDRIKSVEQKIILSGILPLEKKPKDLLRAIGKIESSDWNIREIEKKMKQSKTTEVCSSKTKVPKWSKDQFLARQNKIAKPLNEHRISDEKLTMTDETLKNLSRQLKEDSLPQIGERGKSKVASIAGKFARKTNCFNEASSATQTTSPEVHLNLTQSGLEKCFICKQKLCLAERIFTNGLTVHDSCLKCFHCQTFLREDHYVFDGEDGNGFFFCSKHSKSSPTLRVNETNMTKDEIDAISLKTNRTCLKDCTRLGKQTLRNKKEKNEVKGLRLSDTKSRNLSSDNSFDGDSSSETYECTNDSETNEKTTPLINLPEKKFYSSADDSGDGDDFYDTSESLLDGDTDSPTEDEEIKKAREMRRQEVKLLSPPTFLATDTETEIHTNSESYSSGAFEVNSATEISTDSEFDHEHTIRETPSIIIDKSHLKKSCKENVTQEINLQNSTSKQNELIFKQEALHFQPLIEIDPSLLHSSRVFSSIPSTDQLYNKIAGTGVATSNRNFERKMRYLLGEEEVSKGVMKSGSTTILDTRLKRFHSNISDCQQLSCQTPDLSLFEANIQNDMKVINSIIPESNIPNTEGKYLEDEQLENQLKFDPESLVSTCSSTVVARSSCTMIHHNQGGLENVDLLADISVTLPTSKNISEVSEHITRIDSKSSSNDTVIGKNILSNRFYNVDNKNIGSLCDSYSLSGFDSEKYDGNYSETELDIGGPVLTETELSDWAVDDVVSENLLNFELELRPNKTVHQKENNIQNSSRIQCLHTDQFNFQPIDNNGLCEVLKVEEIEFMDTGLEASSCFSLTSTKTMASKRNNKFFEEIDSIVLEPKSLLSSEGEQRPCSSISVSCLNSSQKNKDINYIDQGIYIFRNKNDDQNFKQRNQYFFPKKENISSLEFKQHSFETHDKCFKQTTSKENSQTDETFDLTFLPEVLPKIDISSVCIPKLNENKNLETTQTSNIDPLKKKLKKIAEDRKKQKDLIYDLVMNRLQNKKHTNTEKKLQNGNGIRKANFVESHLNYGLKQDQDTVRKARTEGNVSKTKKGALVRQTSLNANCLDCDEKTNLFFTLERFNQKNNEQVSKGNETNSILRKPLEPYKFFGHPMNKILASSKSLNDMISSEKLPQYFDRKLNFRSDTNLVFSRHNEI